MNTEPRSLVLSGLVKSYDGRHNAVDRVDLTVRAGEFVSFLGPSGSGKTTTLMMIAGFEQPTSGEIRLGERALTAMPAWERNIGMVFQSYALFPHMSVRDNVAYPLRMRRLRRAEIASRVDRFLAMVGLAAFGNRKPAELSGGQQQRVALARALVFEPGLVLLDEPLGALDKSLREQMQVELRRIHRELGVTMIFVTHDQSEAMTMSDRIAVFNRGRIEHVGTPTEIYFRPKTRFVASFVGDSNLFDGTVREDGLVEVPGFGQIATADATPVRGSPTTVLLRPEAIALGPIAPASPTANTLVATDVLNHGDTLLVIGQAGGQTVRVRVPGRIGASIETGSALGLAWRPQDVRVVDG